MDKPPTLRFTYLIGDVDDFDSIPALVAAASAPNKHDIIPAAYDVDVPGDVSAFGFSSPEELALVIARGLAFEDNWSMPDTVSTIIQR